MLEIRQVVFAPLFSCCCCAEEINFRLLRATIFSRVFCHRMNEWWVWFFAMPNESYIMTWYDRKSFDFFAHIKSLNNSYSDIHFQYFRLSHFFFVPFSRRFFLQFADFFSAELKSRGNCVNFSNVIILLVWFMACEDNQFIMRVRNWLEKSVFLKKKLEETHSLILSATKTETVFGNIKIGKRGTFW